jgi:signal transduction histidine kinase
VTKSVKLRFFIVLFLLTGWGTFIAAAQDTVVISAQTSSMDFHKSVKYFIDSLDAFDNRSVGKERLKSAVTLNYAKKAYNGGNIWCRFVLNSQAETSKPYILEVGGFKEVRVFYRAAGTPGFTTKVTGNYVPYPENERGFTDFMNNKVRVELAPGIPYEFFVLYPDSGVDRIQPEFVVSAEETWILGRYHKNLKHYMTFLPFVGICIILALISFIYYFIQREKAYLSYTAYIIASLLFAASRSDSMGFESLVKHPVLYQSLPSISVVLTIIAYTLFLKSFLNIKARFPFWNKVLSVLVVYLLFALVVTLWLIAVSKVPITALNVRNYFLLLNMLVFSAFLARVLIHRNILDLIFLGGTTVLALATSANIVLDLLEKGNELSTPIFQFGVLVELTTFNIGLGLKLKFSIKEREEAGLKLIDQLKENEELQKSINHKLEIEVQERTAEIQAQNEELITQQEELAAQRDMLEDQNKVIADSMKALQQIRRDLEKTVERRTVELRNTNLELIQRNDQLEQYAYITAHNLRGPVARLKGLIFLFDKLGGTNNENREVFEKITSSAHEMDDVLTDMNAILEVKTNKQGRTAFVKIRTALEKAQEALQDKIIDARPSIEADLTIAEIYGNPTYLESIFVNLLDNSMKYRSAKRELKIGIASRSEKGQIVIEVKDNGIGIDMKRSADKVFKLYQRFHEQGEGKGLGLYLVKTQVEAMGGSISIESEVDVGTTFRILIPE